MIETVLKWLGLIIICVVLQTSLIPLMSIWGIQPDLLLIVLFFLSIRHGMNPGIFVGFLLGLGLDLFTPAHLGQHALAKTITGCFLGSFNEKVVRTDPIFKAVIIVIGFVIHDIVFSGVEFIKNDSSLSLLPMELLTQTLPRSLYTIVIISLVYVWRFTIQPNFKR